MNKVNDKWRHVCIAAGVNVDKPRFPRLWSLILQRQALNVKRSELRRGEARQGGFNLTNAACYQGKLRWGSGREQSGRNKESEGEQWEYERGRKVKNKNTRNSKGRMQEIGLSTIWERSHEGNKGLQWTTEGRKASLTSHIGASQMEKPSKSFTY